ncbi:MAG: STAS domain-containing protein [Candidatus Methylacidiphilales bacterium]
MEISKTVGGTVTTVHLNGRLDASTSSNVETFIGEIFDGGAQALIIDFTKLNYISSAGLRVLLSVAKRAKTAQAKLALFGLTDEVKQIFDISGFTNILPVLQDEIAARDAVTQ